MPIPVDFEKVVKLPDANGYPYSLRSDDLMKNFAWCDLLPSDEDDSIRIELDEVPGKTQQHRQRRLRLVDNPNGHPWKVTDNTDGTVTIAAGFILGYYMTASGSSWTDPSAAPGVNTFPDTVVLGVSGTYSGGTVSIDETSYIYALVPRNGATQTYAESAGGDTNITEVKLGDIMQPIETDTVVIATSTDSPSAYDPGTSLAAALIAKVEYSASALTVTQYVTHNPTMFIPVVGTLSYELPP